MGEKNKLKRTKKKTKKSDPYTHLKEIFSACILDLNYIIFVQENNTTSSCICESLFVVDAGSLDSDHVRFDSLEKSSHVIEYQNSK